MNQHPYNRNNKALKTALRKITAVSWAIKNTPLTEKEWAILNDIYRIMGKIRSTQLDWKEYVDDNT